MLCVLMTRRAEMFAERRSSEHLSALMNPVKRIAWRLETHFPPFATRSRHW